MKNTNISLSLILTVVINWSMQASFINIKSNKHEVLATSEDKQVYVTIADKIYHVHGSLLVIDEKIKQAQEGTLTSVEKAALPLWTVKYANKTLLHVGYKTQEQCNQDLKSVTNEMAYSCLSHCCYQRTDIRVKREMEDCLADLHKSEVRK